MPPMNESPLQTGHFCGCGVGVGDGFGVVDVVDGIGVVGALVVGVEGLVVLKWEKIKFKNWNY